MTDRQFHAKISLGDVEAVVRRATHADYQAVIDIDHDIYDGIDYIPTMFHQFLHSKQHLMLVIELHGKLVGLIIYRFDTDRPHIVAALAGRVARERRGQGFMHEPLDNLRREVARQFPQMTHQLFVTRSKFLKPGTCQNLYQWEFLHYRFSMQSLRTRLADYRPPQSESTASTPRQLTYQTIDDLLASSDRLERFLDRYCVDYVPGLWHWRPMRIDKRGLKELFAAASLVLYTDDDESASAADDRVVVGMPSKQPPARITSISYSYFLPAKIGLIANVWFFGDDLSVAASHAVLHARHLATIWLAGNVAFNLHFPQGTDELVRDVFGDQFADTDLTNNPFVLGLQPFVASSNL